jgi:hypothetical protein
MSDTQDTTTDAPSDNYHDEWIIWNYDSGTARVCEDQTEAEQKKADAMAEFDYDTDPEIFPPGEMPDDAESETVPCAACGDGVTPADATYGPQNEPYHEDCHDGVEVDESDGEIDGDAEPVEPEVVVQRSDDSTPTPATESRPALNDVEEQARAIIQSLTGADMNRLVWDPTAAQRDVPYDPSTLPYDTLEPSAEAFDLFASVMEGIRDVVYSVEDVEFAKDEETLECTVWIEKRGDGEPKQLIGMKTRERHGNDLDHSRERLYSKARRNALKQDIPPTLVSTLLQRYERVKDAPDA